MDIFLKPVKTLKWRSLIEKVCFCLFAKVIGSTTPASSIKRNWWPWYSQGCRKTSGIKLSIKNMYVLNLWMKFYFKDYRARNLRLVFLIFEWEIYHPSNFLVKVIFAGITYLACFCSVFSQDLKANIQVLF